MHYYRYRPEESKDSEGTAASTRAFGSPEDISIATSRGRAIDPKPVLSLLLEPRSLVVTTTELYTHHLHGIDGITSDVFRPHLSGINTGGLQGSDLSIGEAEPKRCVIANHRLLGSSEYSQVIECGGVLERSTRTSLTCRVVEKVVNGIGQITRSR